MAATKTILVTGAGSGIGRAIARRFSEGGWLVGLADVSANGLSETGAQLAGPSVEILLDVRDPEQWARALDRFVEEAGTLDVLANNAGIGVFGPLETADIGELDTLIDINFKGVLWGAKAALPYLRSSQGVLLNTASASSIYGSTGLAAYSATKFAVRALTEALDDEWATHGIRVRGLIPGFINTPMLDVVATGADHPLRNMAEQSGYAVVSPEQVAEAAWRAVHGGDLFVFVDELAETLRDMAGWNPEAARSAMR